MHQPSKVFLEQHHLLLTSRAYWLDEPSAEGKLLYEGWRDPRKRRHGSPYTRPPQQTSDESGEAYAAVQNSSKKITEHIERSTRDMLTQST